MFLGVCSSAHYSQYSHPQLAKWTLVCFSNMLMTLSCSFEKHISPPDTISYLQQSATNSNLLSQATFSESIRCLECCLLRLHVNGLTSLKPCGSALASEVSLYILIHPITNQNIRLPRHFYLFLVFHSFRYNRSTLMQDNCSFSNLFSP